jgi:hypothetical protein
MDGFEVMRRFYLANNSNRLLMLEITPNLHDGDEYIRQNTTRPTK